MVGTPARYTERKADENSRHTHGEPTDFWKIKAHSSMAIVLFDMLEDKSFCLMQEIECEFSPPCFDFPIKAPRLLGLPSISLGQESVSRWCCRDQLLLLLFVLDEMPVVLHCTYMRRGSEYSSYETTRTYYGNTAVYFRLKQYTPDVLVRTLCTVRNTSCMRGTLMSTITTDAAVWMLHLKISGTLQHLRSSMLPKGKSGDSRETTQTKSQSQQQY